MKRVVLAVVILLTFYSTGAPAVAQPPTTKLVVFIVVDQMRGDYLVHYGPLFERGLKRLTTEGAWYRNGAYPYMTTVTCVGHSTIGTGTLPYKHGMIGNTWFDRPSEKVTACTTDADTTDVSYGSRTGPSDSAKWMMMPTLAETMRDRLKARVATMSMKARSAIGLAGHEGDFVTWFGEGNAFETSSAYARSPSGWFVDYLKANPVERDADKTWERTLPANRYQGEDDSPYERAGGGWSAKFPHPLGPQGFYLHWLQSPFADDYLGGIAIAAVNEMHLGTQDRTDFLGVSFGMVDAVGHAFGPQSHELQDTLVRLDATIGRLLDHLDKQVGAGRYVVALSADHGVADFPEVAGGGRQAIAPLRAAIEDAIKKAFGEEGPFIAALATNDVYFKRGVYERLRANPAALKSVIAAMTAQPGIARVFTSDELAVPDARASQDPQIRAAALSYYPGRSGDLTFLVKEHWLTTPAGTTHGTSYAYDQQVPVVLYGAGIKAGVREDVATPADLAVTVASLLGIALPAPDGRVLSSALTTTHSATARH